jgi:hypothetical protein
MASVLIILILIAAVVAFFVLRSGETLRFETSAEPQEIIMAAIGLVGSKRHWQTVNQSTHSVTFRYRKGANMLVALILLLCFLIPGILYLVLAGKNESLALNINQAASGTVVQITSNGYRGKSAGRALRQQVGASAIESGARRELTS